MRLSTWMTWKAGTFGPQVLNEVGKQKCAMWLGRTYGGMPWSSTETSMHPSGFNSIPSFQVDGAPFQCVECPLRQAWFD